MTTNTNITFIIKTFERPDALKNLLVSINQFYPKNRVLIADDGKIPYSEPLENDNMEYFKLDYDSGLSYGRKFLVNKVDTKYFLLLDDDYVFSRETQIEEFERILSTNNDIHMVGGLVINYGEVPIYYHGCLEIKQDILYHHRKQHKMIINEHKIYDIILNFFLAETEKVKSILWDPDLKVLEHEDFFLRCTNKINITYTEDVSILHYPKCQHQEKRKKFTTLFWEKYKIVKEIQLEDGEEIELIHWQDYNETEFTKKERAKIKKEKSE
jgi:GT2 family glycosyltransferase